MSEGTELIKIDDLGVGGEVQKFTDDQFLATAQSGAFLPRLQFMSARSSKCASGDFPINHFASVRDQTFTDLGATVDLLNIAWRPKALHTGDVVITSFDPESESFRRIQTASGVKDNQDDMYGPEFLVWIPSIKEFVTFFMCSASMRRESPQMKARLRQAVTLDSQEIKTAKFQWFSAVVKTCSTPLSEMPDMEKLKAEAEKFNNPKESDVEVVEEDGATDERAR